MATATGSTLSTEIVADPFTQGSILPISVSHVSECHLLSISKCQLVYELATGFLTDENSMGTILEHRIKIRAVLEQHKIGSFCFPKLLTESRRELTDCTHLVFEYLALEDSQKPVDRPLAREIWNIWLL